jgi:hypothetical protein
MLANEIAFIFSVTIQRRLRSNAAIHLATANATNMSLDDAC